MRKLLKSTSAYKILLGDVAKNSVAHAYMLCFEDSRNMRLALREMAKLIVGGDERVERLIDGGAYSDCREYPEDGKKLTVDIAAEIVTESNIRPVEGDKKLFLLSGFEEASPAVQNKLLKVLEEPPAGVIFLLGAANEFSVLPTVKSRVRMLSVPPFTEEALAAFLARNYSSLSDEERAEYAGACGGIAGDAEHMIEGGYFSDLTALAVGFISAEEEDFPSLTQKLNALKQKKEFIGVLKIMYRDMLMYKAGAPHALLVREAPAIKNAAAGYTAAGAVAALESITSAERDMKFNANFAMLALELLIKIRKEKNS